MTTLKRRGATYDGLGYWHARGGVLIPQNTTPAIPTYGPFKVTMSGTTNAAKISSLNSQGLNVPTDANLVMWPYSNPDGAFLDTVFATLGANDILVLPEIVHTDGSDWPYLIDSAPGFRRASSDARHYFSMGRCTRGMLGLGPKSIVSTTASSFTAPQQPVPFTDPVTGGTVTGCVYKIIESSTQSCYMGNFEMRGRSFGGCAYSALAFNKGGGIAEHLFGNAAHRGFKNSPNGEAGFVTMKSNSSDTDRSGKVTNTEVECRDSTGARVGSSPIMFNSMTQGITMTDNYLHHSSAGMPTCWTVSGGITYTRVRSEWNGGGGGGLNGAGFNFELCSGTATLTDCTMICNYLGNTDSTQGTGNTEMHLQGGSDQAMLVINIYNATIDKGPDARNIAGTSKFAADGTFTLACQLFGYTPQYGLSLNRRTAPGGTVLPTHIYGAITAP